MHDLFKLQESDFKLKASLCNSKCFAPDMEKQIFILGSLVNFYLFHFLSNALNYEKDLAVLKHFFKEVNRAELYSYFVGGILQMLVPVHYLDFIVRELKDKI